MYVDNFVQTVIDIQTVAVNPDPSSLCINNKPSFLMFLQNSLV